MRRRSTTSLSVIALCVVATCSDPAPTTGTLIVEITGLPSSVPAAVVVTGPAGFQRTLQTTTTLDRLAPGAYAVSGGLLTTPTALYRPDSPTHNVSVAAGEASTLQFPYALSSGSIELSVTGLPAGVGPSVSIVSDMYVRTITSTGLVHAIPAGEYIVRADTFAASTGDRFGAAVVEQPLTITASQTPVPVSVAYGAASGTLNLVVTGLSASGNDAIAVTGAAGFTYQTSTSTMLRGLRPGSYTVTPRQIVQCPTVFTPATSPQTVEVLLAQVTDATVPYQSSQPGPETLNLSIESAYLTQAVQNAAGRMPIVAGRPALLRVFGIANQCNSVTPVVRVRFSDGDSVTIAAPEASVAFVPRPTQLTTSWNVLLPANRIVPGMTFEAEIDAGNAILEADETDNRHPAAGQSTPVVEVAPFGVEFVPITQAGVTGDVSEANVPEYLRATTQMLPLGVITTTIAAPFTTNVVLGNGTSSAFSTILHELETKRVADGATSHYYGVLRPAPGINFVQVGGIAYIGGRTALGITVGWFSNPRQATELVAHELAHNFGQRHAPCGSAGSPDPSYPYPGGSIGVPGYDLSTATTVNEIGFKSPNTPDIMGYCDDPWISDYMYGRILTFRGPPVVALTAPVLEPDTAAVLVSGMISPDSIRLDPAFHITTRPVLPASDGRHWLEGRAADGHALFHTSFTALPTDHGDPSIRYFTFAIPLAEVDIARLSTLELIGEGRRAVRESGGFAQRLRLLAPEAAADASGVAVTARSSALVDLEWDAAQWPSILVRDPATRSLLAIGRGGRARVATRGQRVELVMSDGARTVVVERAVTGR
jgi:hypothetical protein